MLTDEMAFAYREAFGRFPFILEPSNTVVVEDDDGNIYEIADTEKQFLDRVKRSKKAKENLFFKECRKIEQKDNVLY